MSTAPLDARSEVGVSPVLLDDAQGAVLWGVGVRTFLEQLMPDQAPPEFDPDEPF